MLRPVHDVENLLSDAGFWTAFAIAMVGTVLVWVRAGRGEFEPGITLVAALAGVLGLWTNDVLRARLVVAIILLALVESLTLVGALLAAALISLEPRLRHTLGFAAIAGLFVWVAVYGGLGRSGAVVGGIACLGVVLLVPLVREMRTRGALAVVFVMQCALVAY